jgi:Large polyvalent protein-associated domain 11
MEFDIFKSDDKFRYQLLSRLQQDCNYFLGNGNRNEHNLWASNVKEQINTMKKLWESFSSEDKPEWLTWDEILDYENKMK